MAGYRDYLIFQEERKMDANKFWSIIDQARKKAGHWEEMILPLMEVLAELDVPEIMTWTQIFYEYQQLSYKNKLWAAAYVINGGCSDDGFDYFRAWLTAQGKDVFMAALHDPDSLADVEDCEDDVEFEDMLSAGSEAYFKKLNAPRDYDKFYEMLDQYPLTETIT
jgi:hypothetical protein